MRLITGWNEIHRRVPVADDNGDMWEHTVTDRVPIYEDIPVSPNERLLIERISAIIERCDMGGAWTDYVHEEDMYLESAVRLYDYCKKFRVLTVGNLEQFRQDFDLRKFMALYAQFEKEEQNNENE